MKKRQPILISGLVVVAALVLAACGSAQPDEGAPAAGDFPKNADGYADISVAQLAELLKAKDLSLVNVHIPYEGEIPQTDLFIPFDEIADHLAELPGKDDRIVLYCRSGSMSTSAAQELAALGYTNVLEVDGGFNAWAAAGNELIQR